MKNKFFSKYGLGYCRNIFYSLSAILILSAGTCNENTLKMNQNKNKQTEKMIDIQHPGTIKITNVFENTTKEKSIKDIPESKWFVYLNDGVETLEKEEATEILPIVEVRMLSLDEKGKLVASEKASTIRIKEYGPDERLLRSTTMVSNKKKEKE